MYQYPDINEANFLNNVFNEDWDDGGLEFKYLEASLNKIPQAQRNTVLDMGCGQGKFTPSFTPFFKKIIGIDPDITRLDITIALAEHFKAEHSDCHCTFEFQSLSMQEFESNEKMDCIFGSHVIQHVQSQDVPTILEKSYSMLQKIGFLILTTTNCLDNNDVFLKVNTLTNEHITVSEKEFNDCVALNSHELPTRLFTEKTLRQLLQNSGFEILSCNKYHGYPKIKGDNFIFAKKV